MKSACIFSSCPLQAAPHTKYNHDHSTLPPPYFIVAQQDQTMIEFFDLRDI